MSDMGGFAPVRFRVGTLDFGHTAQAWRQPRVTNSLSVALYVKAKNETPAVADCTSRGALCACGTTFAGRKFGICQVACILRASRPDIASEWVLSSALPVPSCVATASEV